jgi:hypothetical protein
MRILTRCALLLLFTGSALAQPAAAPEQGLSREAGRFDNGKMWTFDHPPTQYFRSEYGFEPDERWFEEARLGALRIPGCSASFASPYGLVLTNHHCGRSSVSQVSKASENLLDNGFYAPSLDEERRVEDYYADQLVAIEDVTDEVYAALEGTETDAEKAAARQEAITAVTERVREAAGGEGFHVEVISLYNGAQYSAYTFRRYEDVRLVMAPELQLGYFGGDSDNFTYPRYALDMTLFRVYGEDGEPLKTSHYFQWNTEGSHAGEAVFVIGNPGSTSRLETVSQLAFREDVQDRAVLDLVNSRVAAMQAFYDAAPEEAEALDLRNQIFSLMNAQKLYQGRMKALTDPDIMARRANDEQAFRDVIESDSALQAEYGGLHEQMAEIQRQKAEYGGEYASFLAMQPTSGLASAVFRRAIQGYIYFSRLQQGADADALQGLQEQLLGIEDQPHALQEGLLTARLTDFLLHFGTDDEAVSQILRGRTPAEAAAAIVAGSALADSASLAEAMGLGTPASDATAVPRPAADIMDDPALQLAAALFPRLQAFQSAFAGLGAQEQEIASALGRARFDVYGTAVPPDATFSLRIADGVVQSYDYNGTVAPAYTTYYGLYDRHYGHTDGTEWDLPERWLEPPASFDLSTPVNMVTTADIIGGNSGSPLVNKDLELVGLMFDGNIESLSGDYIYLPEAGARSVAVDVRGMLEALGEIYDADRLVLELTTGTLARTEAEADAEMGR